MSQINRRLLLLASVTTPGLGASGCATRAPAQDVERYIVAQSQEWTRSYTSGNTDVMERILAEDFVSTSPRGKRSGKRESIASAKEAPAIFEATEVGQIEVRVFDGMALAFGGDALVLKAGNPREVKKAWTDTWIYRRGEWLVVASHESVVRPEQQ